MLEGRLWSLVVLSYLFLETIILSLTYNGGGGSWAVPVATVASLAFVGYMAVGVWRQRRARR